MKIISFEPPYSNYFNDLASVLCSKDKRFIERELVASSPAYKIYMPDFKFVPIKLLSFKVIRILRLLKAARGQSPPPPCFGSWRSGT